MDALDTPEAIEQKLDAARDRLRRLEEDVSGAQLVARLRAGSRAHPTLVARTLSALLTVISLVAGLATLAAPIVSPDLSDALLDLDRVLGWPLPAWFLVCTGFMALAWGLASAAAYAVAREYPMLRWEAEEVERLRKQIKRLDEDLRFARSTAAPQPTAGPLTSPRFPGRWPSRERALSSGSHKLPSSEPEDLVAIDGGGDGGPLVSFDERPLVSFDRPPATSSAPGREPETRGGTPLGAPPLRSGKPIGAMGTPPRSDTRFGAPVPLDFGNDDGDVTPASTGKRAVPRIDVPLPSPAPRVEVLAPRPDPPTPVTANATPPPRDAMVSKVAAKADSAFGLELPDIVDHSTYTVTEHTSGTPMPPSRSSTPQAAASQDLPRWGRVDEPWLEDAIARAEDLARTYPVQARLEFSIEANLPFSLYLERATPAMAVRCMVSYVEFLASIATPPRGRVVLRAVPHLDRSFHRNVEAALDPYFSERARVERDGEKVEITFTDPDARWMNYPVLPML